MFFPLFLLKLHVVVVLFPFSLQMHPLSSSSFFFLGLVVSAVTTDTTGFLKNIVCNSRYFGDLDRDDTDTDIPAQYHHGPG